MPLYEYECLECGVQFEKLQRFGAAPPETCPNGHAQVHRRLSQPAIIFKGSGFYITDNGRNGSRKSNGIPAGSKNQEVESAEAASTPTNEGTESKADSA